MIYPAVKIHCKAASGGCVEIPNSTGRRLLELTVLNTGAAPAYVWLIDAPAGSSPASRPAAMVLGRIEPGQTLSLSSVGAPFQEAVFVGLTTNGSVLSSFAGAGAPGSGIVSSMISQEPS